MFLSLYDFAIKSKDETGPLVIAGFSEPGNSADVLIRLMLSRSYNTNGVTTEMRADISIIVQENTRKVRAEKAKL